jgi:hypothetical protein
MSDAVQPRNKWFALVLIVLQAFQRFGENIAGQVFGQVRVINPVKDVTENCLHIAAIQFCKRIGIPALRLMQESAFVNAIHYRSLLRISPGLFTVLRPAKLRQNVNFKRLTSNNLQSL